ncbi:MAG: hypothetical protein AABW89_03860 [Nanoarchaeota archaeon]
MVTVNKKAEQVLLILLRNMFSIHTATSLANKVGMSRWGIWKILKELEYSNLILLTPIGSGKTSAYTVRLEWDSPILNSLLILGLTKESLEYERWRANFRELSDHTEFLILYGSIIHSPKEANDIDILGVVSNKKSFVKINEIISKIQKTQTKKIHSINFTPAEFSYELKKSNKAFIDALKKGIILYGQDNFVKFIKEFKK